MANACRLPLASLTQAPYTPSPGIRIQSPGLSQQLNMHEGNASTSHARPYDGYTHPTSIELLLRRAALWDGMGLSGLGKA